MSFIIAIASLFAAFIPMFIYLMLIWWMDRNEREPFWMLLINFVWGATGAIILGIIGSIIFQIPLSQGIEFLTGSRSPELMDLSGAVITAPVVEESTKGIFLVMMSFMKRFDGVVDGVVYGGAIGLGFGMTENFLYFVSFGTDFQSWFTLVIIRTLFSAVLHCMAQATFGGFLGYAKFKPAVFKIFLIPIGFGLAMFLHFTWNLTVSFQSTSIIGMLFLIIYTFSIIAIFQIALFMEGKTIANELKEEAGTGLIPSEHLNYLSFVSKRFKFGWCPVGVNQKEYVRTAIELALRKYQYKNTKGNTQKSYLSDVENLRYKIQMMFYNASVQYYNNNAARQ
ncbi:MAG: PrsW family intramembrane metalloprotease [Ignavibacteriae bacterium]|nr:PrsW family intramembrane metalloprotease [Ignavibacteriota bacterium]